MNIMTKFVESTVNCQIYQTFAMLFAVAYRDGMYYLGPSRLDTQRKKWQERFSNLKASQLSTGKYH